MIERSWSLHNLFARLGVTKSQYSRHEQKFFKKRTNKRQRKKFIKRRAYEGTPMSNTNEFFLASSDLSDHMTTKLMSERIGKNTFLEEVTLLGTNQAWRDFVKKTYGDEKKYHVFHYGTHGMLIIDNRCKSWMDCSLNSTGITLKLYGTQKEIETFLGDCAKRFEIAESYIEWIYSTDGQSVNVPLRTDRKPFNEMYPFLKGESIEDYYDRFIDSDASILVLIGPPGTGKTTFIRGLLQHTKSSAIVTYDASILEKDFVFAQFIEGDTNIMVLEDADNFLKARKEGNTIMHKFLNVGDGLVTTKGKKMIFSTNLPSINDIDSALVRPGRCFDIVMFDNLDKTQAAKLASVAGVTLKENKNNYSIAEVFNGSIKTENKINRKVGFV